MSHWLKLTVGIAALVVAVGCSNSGDSSTPSESGKANSTDKPKSLKIAMIAKSSTNPVFLASRTGAEAAAKDLSTKTGVEITIDWKTPAQEDPQVQAQNIAQAVNEGAGAILVSCSDAAKVTNAINDAVDKGVPVMTFDSDAPASKRFAFYGADDIAVGKQVMSELAKQLPGGGKVAILAGNQNAPNLQKRVQGVKDDVKNHPGFEIVGVFNHPETPQDAAAAVLQAMKSYPEIKGWAMIGGWPLFTPTLIEDLKKLGTKVVAVDALPPQLLYVDAGVAPVLLAQPVYNWGYVSVGKIVDKVINKASVDVVNKMDLVPVTKESLNSWAKQLRDWGMEGIDPKFLK